MSRGPIRAEVVIVGSGIAGGALATVLARAGIDVLALERQNHYHDRVLGEVFYSWGVAEIQRLGLLEALQSAEHGYRILVGWRTYGLGLDPAAADAEYARHEFVRAVGDEPGALAVRHPDACETLARAAQKAGAIVLRGVSEVSVTPGHAPFVTYRHDGEPHDVRPRLVIGADGKVSTIRRLAGFELIQDEAHSIVAGMLAGGLGNAPDDAGISSQESDRLLIGIPQAAGHARLYVCWPISDRKRYDVADRERVVLEAWRGAIPWGDTIAKGWPAGPCGIFPLHSARVDRPVIDGVVLAGDAAGWIDPLIGQGTSVAMRDARVLSDILLASKDWSAAALMPYVEERAERMRRLRLSAHLCERLWIAFDPDGERRRAAVDALPDDDPLNLILLAQTIGPDRVPGEPFDETAVAARLDSL